MDRAEVHGLVDAVFAVDAGWRGRDELAVAAAAVGRLRAWVDSREMAVAHQLAQVSSRPEQVLVQAGRCSTRQANDVLERAHTAQALPELGTVLAAGLVSAGHVDVVTHALRRLEPAQRPQLVERAGWLAELATRTTPDELQRAVTTEVRRIEAGDGLCRLERQRRAIRLHSWVDHDGMWCLSGRFDPETGIVLHQRLAVTVARLFAERSPDDAPGDPVERQAFVRAHALVALLTGHDDGQPSRPAPPEVVVVVDTTTVDDGADPAIDWGLPVELPLEVLHRHFEHARVRPVIIRGGAVLHAPGRLDLGRATRLANRAQRRALLALYPTCAIPGCPTRFELCKLHHVIWWEHGGSTDLANLLPLCVSHHHAVHDQGWQLTLSTDRQLTIRYPDSTEHTTSPPRRMTSYRPPPMDAPPGPAIPAQPDRLQPLVR